MASKPKDEKAEDDAKPAEGAAAEGGADGAAPAEGEAKPAGKSKLMIIIAAAVVLLIGGGAGLYFSGILGGAKKPADAAAAGKDAAGKEGEKGKDGKEGAATAVFLPIPTMIVNLTSDDGTPRYLRLTVQLELKDEKDLKAVQTVIPRVIDQFQTYLRELRVKDLRGSAGIYRLQMELLWRVNQAAAPVEVKDVLFQEILIQ